MPDHGIPDGDRTQILPQGPPGGRRPVRAPDAPPGTGVRRPGQPAGDGYDLRGSGEPTQRGQQPFGPGVRPAVRPAQRPGQPVVPSGTRRRRRPLRALLLLLVLALVAYPLALLGVAWNSLNRTAALDASTANTPGRSYLVVGSDSRAGLTGAQKATLSTGDAPGRRTDTILVLHVPSGGGPSVLMSIPRDSYVAIPGHGHNKVNAAFSFGGARLLAQTVEQSTGIQIDDYVEIGFAGFAGMVDAVGGVQICPKRDMDDVKAGLNIKKGCQQADGATALGYARARYSDPRGDLGRVERQRELMAAIVAKGSGAATLGNPFRAFRLASSGAGTLTVDEDTGPVALGRFVLGMRSASTSGISLTVPVAGTARRPGAGSVVLWDQTKSAAVFAALKRDDTEAVRAYATKR